MLFIFSSIEQNFLSTKELKVELSRMTVYECLIQPSKNRTLCYTVVKSTALNKKYPGSVLRSIYVFI